MSNPQGYVHAVCFSKVRGRPKIDRGAGILMQGYGLEGDAHAGIGSKQISILLEQYLEPVIKQLGYKPAPGSFAENLRIGGLEDKNLNRGTVLKIGEAIVKITAIGKEDPVQHTYSFKGYSLLAEKGLFGQVLKSGRVESGNTVTILEN